MYDIITFGSATWDIFLEPEKYKVKKDRSFVTGKGICFNLGSKVDVKNIHFSSGGGGTNTAVAFLRQGFKVAYCGSIGDDVSGKEIVEELKRLGVDTKFIVKKRAKTTNHSIILNLPKERTILVHRGASEFLLKKDIPWDKLKAKWLYLGPLSGKLSKITEDIIDFASKKRTRVALNPGSSQLSLPKKTIKKILGKVDVLILNQEEASLLTGIDYKKEQKIFKKIDKLCSGIVIMTKGSKGSVVSDGKYLFEAGIVPVKVLDRTGAGDSFASGFVSGFIKTGDVKYSIQLATANAASCLQKKGAKKGLLKKGEKFKKVRVSKAPI